MKPLSDCLLYGIFDLGYAAPEDCERVVRAMLKGGVDILQLRAKNTPPQTLTLLAQRLAPLLEESQIPWILNDHPELVLQTGATGFHGGQTDLPLKEARALAGPSALAGRSTHSLAQALQAQEEGTDYIGFGPLFATPTKPGRPPIGLAELQEVHQRVKLPIFCIGGIKQESLPELLEAGVQRVVIVSGILKASDIVTYCHTCKGLLEQHRKNWTASDYNENALGTQR